VPIPAGVYTMGDTHGTGFSDAVPTHLVSLSAYEISNFEITQLEWLNVMGYNPSAYTGNLHRPVESVSMLACLVYCNKKSTMEGLTPVYSVNGSTNPDYWGPIPETWDIPSYAMWSLATCNWSANGYRLPTEAEWEYAARGASVNPDYLYSGGDNIGLMGWYGSNGSLETHPVGQKLANAIGLYDMSGNVREWCWDWYDEDYYAVSPSSNPHGPASEPSTHYRSIRGGSFMDVSTLCMNCARGQKEAYSGQMYIGFRIVRAN
jgi:formylglycine-generating enzyme required for sulfatase activity